MLQLIWFNHKSEDVRINLLTGVQGFEPQSTAPKAGVLPLHHTPPTKIILAQGIYFAKINRDSAAGVLQNLHRQSRGAVRFQIP